MNLSNLIESLHNDECVLLLGPKAAMYEGEYLQDLLTERFVQELRKKGLTISPPYISVQVIKQFLAQFPDTSKGLEEMGKVLQSFYTEFAEEDIPIYTQIAQLPFKYIINTSPDNLIAAALKRNDKDCLFFDFHFNKPEYNVEMNRNAVDLDKEISEYSPLIYNLLGHYTRPDSLVMTDNDRLRFLEVVLQREKEATLPANIAFYFTRKPIKQMRKTYIFVGFDFNEWHFRMFMHLLRRGHEHLPYSFSFQDENISLSGDVQTFYTDNFNMEFVNENAAHFFAELKQQIKKPSFAPPPAQMEMMLLYHPKDEALREEFEQYLATLRYSGMIDVWHECELGKEMEQTIKEHLNSARVIIPLITAEMLASDKLYEYLNLAIARHQSGEAKVYPVLMKPCDIENTPLSQLNIIYPKPRGKAVSQKPNREETLTNIAKDLYGTIELMLKRQPV